MSKYKNREEAIRAAGYQHRGPNEFIFSVDDEQEIFNHLFDIYTEFPYLANRKGTPKGKNTILRKLLEERMGRPIADTGKDFSGRQPYWADKFLSGKLCKQMVAPPILLMRSSAYFVTHIPENMTVKYIPVLVPVGDVVSSYRITFSKRSL